MKLCVGNSFPGTPKLYSLAVEWLIDYSITPVFSVTCSLRNQSNMLICCSRNIFHYYYQCRKQWCWIFFLWKPTM